MPCSLQDSTFDPETIDRELGWAAAIGMNTMRVYLHDIAWQQDPEGFLKRVDRYLELADRHGIRTMFVLFDGVWNPYPKAGPQPEPRPRTHNSGWVQSPGREILSDPKKQDALKPYVVSALSLTPQTLYFGRQSTSVGRQQIGVCHCNRSVCYPCSRFIPYQEGAGAESVS